MLTNARSKEKRSVYIDSTDAKSRQLIAGYMIPTPVWKSSYRLIFGDAGQPMLEGWAIVDNTTGEDWTNVQLSLVSGRPVSFISQLYEPRYIARQQAELPEEAAQRPVVYEGALDAASERDEQEADGESCSSRRGRGYSRRRWPRLLLPPPAPMRRIRWPAASSPTPPRANWAICSNTASTAGHGAQKRIRHAALPAAEDRRAQAADLFRSELQSIP